MLGIKSGSLRYYRERGDIVFSVKKPLMYDGVVLQSPSDEELPGDNKSINDMINELVKEDVININETMSNFSDEAIIEKYKNKKKFKMGKKYGNRPMLKRVEVSKHGRSCFSY